MSTETEIVKEDANRSSGFLSKGSASTAILALAKGTLGAGILFLPQKCMFTGIPLFLLLLPLCGFFTAKSLTMIAKGANYTNKFVFEEITESLLGRGMAITLGISMLVNCYGASIIFVIAIKGSLETLLAVVQAETGQDWPLYATLILGGLVLVPLSIVEKINSLRILTLAGVIGVFFTVASVVYALATLGQSPTLHRDYPVVIFPGARGMMDIMNAISTVTFAFCNQFNFPQVFGELSDRSKSTVFNVATISTLIPLALYSFTAVAGYLCYGLDIQDNILINFAPLIEAGAAMIYIGTIAVSLSVSMCHLLNNFPMRLSVIYFLPESHHDSKWIRYSVPLLTAVSTIAIALLYSDLSLFLGLVGASTGSIICYIVPAMFSMRVSCLQQQQMDEESAVNGNKSTKLWKTFITNPMECIMILVGILIGVLGTFCEFYSFIEKFS